MQNVTHRPTIDFHAHMLEGEVLRRSVGKTVVSGYGTNLRGGPRAVNESTFQKMLDPHSQIEEMDRRGIDINVISSATVIQGTSWAEAQTDLALSQRCNDRAAEWAVKYPGRFIGTFTLPLQDVDLALREMDRAVTQLSMRVVNLCTQYRDVYIGDPRYQPFWEAAAALGIVAWIHPDGPRDLWYQKFGMWNSIGQSIEEVKVMTSLIYEGVMDRFPSLKIVISHGGGYFPHNLGRMDRNVTNFPDSMKNISRKPSEYLRSFYYDTCVYDPSVLFALVQRVGADRLVMGSDCPVGESDPIGFIKKMLRHFGNGSPNDHGQDGGANSWIVHNDARQHPITLLALAVALFSRASASGPPRREGSASIADSSQASARAVAISSTRRKAA
jgi:aminocarboxymuconate-semialdehyde decarboxylase